jgi:hypothetical protein
MASDPAFLFYPGDYLKDTQCLSETVQVAYDRIMCEHMRNICITQQQLNFFTKRLNVEQKEELMHVLSKVSGGFQITWVAESIEKRRNYSESRRKNRSSKKNISKTYDSHMENAIGNENETVNGNKKEFFFEVLKDELWIESLQVTHKGKNIEQAVNEAYQHLLSTPTRYANSDQSDFKRLVNSWLSNRKSEVKVKRDISKL